MPNTTLTLAINQFIGLPFPLTKNDKVILKMVNTVGVDTMQ